VASQFLRRASRGCSESGVVEFEAERVGATPDRRVSCRPGAEGAPLLCEARCEWLVV